MENGLTKYDVVTITLNPAIDRTVTISNFTAGAVNRVQHERTNPGGKGVNVASALADFGHRVAVTGFLGRNNTSSFENLFVEKGIEDRFVRIAGQTRVGIKITDSVLKQTTDINFPGPAPTAADLEALWGQLATLHGTWYVVAGSVPPSIHTAIYRDLITILKSRGSKVLLDASDEPLRRAVEATPDIIKPNIHELEALVGAPLRTVDAVIEAAGEIIAKGVEMVVVSMGKDGACFVIQSDIVIARPPNIEVESTVGAGDAMVAGIVAAQLRRYSPVDCARLATAFSLDALTRGKLDGISSESIEIFKPRIVIE